MSFLDFLNEAKQQLEESMYQHNIVVRWNNGDLEGFSGTALSGAKKAKESAEAKANRKAKMIKKEFSILDGREFAQLDSAQKKRLKRDWELSQKMDESTEINIEESKSGHDKFEYKGLDCYIKWTRFEGNKEKKIAAHTDYSAHCDELDLHTKGYETQSEARKELKDMIDGSIKDRDSDIKEAEEVNKEEPNEVNKEEPNEVEKEMEPESEDFKKHEKGVAKELVAALSVFLFAVENLFNREFESAKEAEDFIFSSFRSLKTREKAELTGMLRRFDKVGGERMANMFRRSLGKELNK